MYARSAVLVAAAVVLAASGGCDLPGQVPTEVPTDIDVPSIEVPTELPSLPEVGGEEETVATEAPEPAPEETSVAPDGGEAAPAPETAAPGATAEPSPGDSVAPEEAEEPLEGIPWWVWLLGLLLVAGLVTAVVLLRRARTAELRWAALWHELTGEARWLDERVVPAVQDRALDPQTLVSRWQDGQRRFDDLDRRVWAAANDEQKPQRAADLNALSEALLRLRDALDTEVQLRATGVDQPGLPDAAQTVADARDDLRRTVNARTR